MRRAIRSVAASLAVLGFLTAGAPADETTPAEVKAKAEQAAEALAEGKQPPADATISKDEAEAVDPQGQEEVEGPLVCLARAVYWESKGEDREDMRAVAAVVLNRLASEEFPDDICAVVKDGGEAKSCQFGWWCDGKSDKVEDQESYAMAKEVAATAINGELSDPTEGALFFHRTAAKLDWTDKYKKTVTLGPHVFYTLKK
ncbi:MAG: cell wall hydrolase [Geminicoccaceae bacterium]|nr:cell wall hydrolase [Geminicoccaceae bacterium]